MNLYAKAILFVCIAGSLVVTSGYPSPDGGGEGDGGDKLPPPTASPPPPTPSANVDDNSGSDASGQQGVSLDNANCTINGTSCNAVPGIFSMFAENTGMLMRTFYVFIGVTAIVVVYFVVRTIRLRHKRSKTKKYGLLSSNDDSMAMTPLDQEDDEDDLTVFEVNGLHK